MEPVKTECSNFVYRGATPDILDLPCERAVLEGGPKDIGSVVFSVWEPTDEERRRVAAGENVKLGIYGMEPVPPVSLEVVREDRNG